MKLDPLTVSCPTCFAQEGAPCSALAAPRADDGQHERRHQKVYAALKLCGACRFFTPFSEQGHGPPPGTCRVRGPVVSDAGRWPVVNPDDWCGKWKKERA